MQKKMVKKRIRHVKTIQYQDEEGYLVDKNVSEYEEFEEESTVPVMQEAFPVKGVKKAAGKGSQGSLQSFFGKK